MKKFLFLLVLPFFIHPYYAFAQQGHSSSKQMVVKKNHPLLTGQSMQQGLDTLSLKSIFYEPLLSGHRPDFIRYSTKKSAIFYSANDSAKTENKLYSVSLSGNNKKHIKRKDFTHSVRLSPDGKKIVYRKKGDIWIADPDFSHVHKLVASKASKFQFEWSPNSRKLAFIQNGNIWVININKTQLTQVTHHKKGTPGTFISGWAGNSKLILSQYNRSNERVYYFPVYYHQYVEPGKSRRGIAKKKISVANLDSLSVTTIYSGMDYVSTSSSHDGKYLAVDYRDDDLKHRTIKEYNLEAGDSTVVFRDSTQGWFAGTGITFSPKGHTLMIKSEKDGWNHLYLVQPDGSGMKKLNHGSFEVPWAHWLNEHSIVFASTKEDPGVRQIYTVNTRNDHVKQLTTKTGFRERFHLSPDKKHLVYKYSYFNTPWELYAIDLNRQKETRLTHTIPQRFKEIDWQKPDYIRFTGRDGSTKISMEVLKPRHLKPNKKYPVVMFIHGAGSLQNVYKGWSNHYFREYMFGQYLTAHGYYVMQVDYRQSLGYGRKFREDVEGWLGKYETHDLVDGVKYLADHYSQADTSSVGIYGGSYGGFMTLYALSNAPQYFDAGAALRAVTDWKNYYYDNPQYTRPRLGTPKADSAQYARSSPITYADSLSRPVLLLHGLRDANVGFKDVVEYLHRLIKSNNKHFHLMIYPTEPHGFIHPWDWYDEYRRIFKFFNHHLK